MMCHEKGFTPYQFEPSGFRLPGSRGRAKQPESKEVLSEAATDNPFPVSPKPFLVAPQMWLASLFPDRPSTYLHNKLLPNSSNYFFFPFQF